MSPFVAIRLSPDLERFHWIDDPGGFSEALSAHLWATHQIDSFRAAAVAYMQTVNGTAVIADLPIPRLAIVMIGQGVDQTKYRLFRKLKPHGTYYRRLDASAGRDKILRTLRRRADAHPADFSHWYIDGGKQEGINPAGVTAISYAPMDPVREKLLKHMRSVLESGAGPEALRTSLARMTPQDVGLDGSGAGGLINRFQISLLTEGSGTQLFSTTWVQWAAREAFRRAQPLTLVARYAPRQRDRSLLDPFAIKAPGNAYDPQGSLVDADMGAYYAWINQQRLSGADKAGFLVWFEDHEEAVAVGPSFQKGAASEERLPLDEVLSRL